MKIEDKLKEKKQETIIKQYLAYGADPEILKMELEEKVPLRDIVEILNLMIFKTEYLKQQNNLKDL